MSIVPLLSNHWEGLRIAGNMDPSPSRIRYQKQQVSKLALRLEIAMTQGLLGYVNSKDFQLQCWEV